MYDFLSFCKFIFIHSFIHSGGGGAETEGERGLHMGQTPHGQYRGQCGAHTDELRDYDLTQIQSRMLNQMSYAGATQ